MQCVVCQTAVGLTSAQRKEHAVIHGYPRCGVCPRVFKNVKSFEKHITEPHETKKCQLKTCDELIVVGKELEHASVRHNFPLCFCGASVESSYFQFNRHINAHKHVADKCKSCDEMIPEWQTLNHMTSAHNFPVCGVCGDTISSNFSNFHAHLESHKQVALKCTCCEELIPQWQSLHHATRVHGFPQCGVCCETISSSCANFYRHLESHRQVAPTSVSSDEVVPDQQSPEHAITAHTFHVKVPEKCLCCDERVPEWKLLEHAIGMHNYPTCQVCNETISSNTGNFFKHVASHDVKSKCPMCPDLVKQKDIGSHASTSHSFPTCTTCPKTFDSVPMFYNHVRKCTTRISSRTVKKIDCPFCDVSIFVDKHHVVKHLIEKHEFTGFECPKCKLGSGRTLAVKSITSLAFLMHVKNCLCLNGRSFKCPNCRLMFKSRYRLAGHDCIRREGVVDSHMLGTRNRRFKERLVLNYLTTEFSKVQWIWNKQVSNGSSNLRPDILCDLGDQIVIVEVDEFQHATYTRRLDKRRELELSRDVGNKPLVIIRFNPDGYTRDGTDIKSCFGTNEHGTMQIATCQANQWKERLTCLSYAVSHWMTMIPSQAIKVVRLFFDD